VREIPRRKIHMLTCRRIEISHGGQTLVLNSPSDITAWIAERKKRFPTKANIEAKKAQDAVEAQKRQEQKARMKEQKVAQRAAKIAKSEERKAQAQAKANHIKSESEGKVEATPDDPQLRIAYLEEQLRLAKEAAARPTTTTASHPPDDGVKANPQDDAGPVAQDQVNGSTGSSDDKVSIKPEPLKVSKQPNLGLSYNSAEHESATSPSVSASSSDISSDSDGDDSDTAPEEASSKAQEPMRVEPPKRTERKPKAPRVCMKFRSTGSCKWGDKCRYSHEVTLRKNGQRDKIAPIASAPRVSLFEKVSA
jgi:hypothetical protein